MEEVWKRLLLLLLFDMVICSHNDENHHYLLDPDYYGARIRVRSGDYGRSILYCNVK